MNEINQFEVEPEAGGTRVDAYLAGKLPEISRARIQSLISDGHIREAKGALKSSYRVIAGDVIIVILPDAKPAEMLGEDIALDILHEDKDLVVLNKAAGLVVHPGAGHFDGTLVNALLHRYPDMQVGDVKRPGLVHRLDKDTSGVMVCARNDATFLSLANQFKSREVTKIYRAFCYGKFKTEKFELITGHTRHQTDRKRFTTKINPPKEEGTGNRLAHSRFEVLLTAGGLSELKVELLTGRTHQIRAHLADLNHPLVLDSLYGAHSRAKLLPATVVREAVLALERHGLHAESIKFKHPKTGKMVSFIAKLPSDLQAVHDAMMMVDALAL